MHYFKRRNIFFQLNPNKAGLFKGSFFWGPPFKKN